MTRGTNYTSPGGLQRDLLPFRLWEKAKQLAWDPARIDFSRDASDWAGLEETRRVAMAGAARGFMIGEEAVTLDILPLLRAMADEGRLEDTMYLTTFAFEEAKHVDFFTRWFEAVGFDARTLDTSFSREQDYGGPQLIDDELPTVMRRLDNDRSPKAILDAAFTYNQFVEAVLAIVGYRIWAKIFARRDILPGFQEGLALVQRDERRHIAYGTYLCRRILSEHEDLWTFVQGRMDDLLHITLRPGGMTERAYGPRFEQYGEMVREQASRRMDLLAATRGMRPQDVEERSSEDDLVPELVA